MSCQQHPPVVGAEQGCCLLLLFCLQKNAKRSSAVFGEITVAWCTGRLPHFSHRTAEPPPAYFHFPFSASPAHFFFSFFFVLGVLFYWSGRRTTNITNYLPPPRSSVVTDGRFPLSDSHLLLGSKLLCVCLYFSFGGKKANKKTASLHIVRMVP